ncbi:MAG: radical SAM protein [Candidatus Omnitrophica bacterium]|nr:radical SAM protein [Candidatus Omnitrophota bacterium]
MITQEYSHFTDTVHRYAHKKRIPLSVLFELTYRCNFRCTHCYLSHLRRAKRPLPELSTQEVYKVLTKLKRMGTLYVGFTGGEIFCRTDVFDILWKAKRLGFQIIILTNGSLIDHNVARELKKLSPNKIDISVYAMSQEFFEKFTGSTAPYKSVLDAVRMLQEEKLPVSLKSCVLEENKNEIIKISNFAHTHNISFSIEEDISKCLDGSGGPLRHRIPPDQSFTIRKKCFPLLFTPKDLKGRTRSLTKNRRILWDNLFPCGVGRSSLVINPEGKLRMCTQINYPLDDVVHGSLEEGWQRIKEYVDALKPPLDWECPQCDLLHFCRWCPGVSYLEDGTFFS